MPVTIRDITAADEPRWRELWAGYLEFYEYPDLDPKVTDHTWSMLTDGGLTGPHDDVFGLVAEVDGPKGREVIGIVHCVVHANTWVDKPICYLEDLFVDPAQRGQGAGRALIDAVIKRAADSGWGQVYWRTATGNPARKLYDQVADVIDFVTYVKPLGSPRTI